jgi:RNA polymerase sigma factor (sigma-70 family)
LRSLWLWSVLAGGVVEKPMTDGQLVRQALAGRTAAYGELARRWSAPILALCHARIRSVDTAEDLAQETLLRGLRGLATLADPDRFGPWLRGIATRVCLDWLKARGNHQVAFSVLSADRDPAEMLVAPADGPEQAAQQADERTRLLAAVEELPEECREVLMLYYYQDVTYQEVATSLGVSAATVNARLTRARALLRERLAGLRR